MRKFFTPFVTALILSVILHVTFIAGISGLGGFDFIFPLSRQVFFARLVPDEPRPGISGAALKKAAGPASLMRKGAGKPVREDVSPVPKEPAANPPEESRPPEEEAAASAPAPDTGVANTGDAAQAADEDPPAQVPPQAQEKAGGLLRASREKLSYDIYWMNIYVGRAVLEAVSTNDTLKITSRVHSSQFISNFYKVEDFTESVLVNGLPSISRIKLSQGKSRSDKETIFDAANRKITFFNYLKGTKDEHTFQAPVQWDYISGFYFLRTQLLEPGKKISIDIFDSNKFLKAEVNVLAKEKVKLHDESEIDAVVVAVLRSEGLFQSKGEIRIWLTDNESKVPVRIEMKVPIGKVTAELKALETEK